ncbi:hypothetical protein E2C01_086893 [Portunus trituberculatus]|uniref:Uncharacterized protein n=1 Tax=Portunus trituberculatus TaxID=210409 RepID=A0A5B7J6K0_PORTR|nr:hypothetical protein [Portunus trituberculatus]
MQGHVPSLMLLGTQGRTAAAPSPPHPRRPRPAAALIKGWGGPPAQHLPVPPSTTDPQQASRASREGKGAAAPSCGSMRLESLLLRTVWPRLPRSPLLHRPQHSNLAGLLERGRAGGATRPPPASHVQAS